jgi:cobyric acid synthase
MRGLQNINVEIVIHEDGTTHGGNANGLFSNLEIVNGLCDQTMGDTVVTTRTEMERNIDQTFRAFKNEFHTYLQKSEIRISPAFAEAASRRQVLRILFIVFFDFLQYIFWRG